ncbi:hypothetical protein [Cohnella hongkongensis]|uniref:Uncharacterized protein n=1 Tax=Cohnella hongkongensis TaxID=178337 RepID=A0ABV9FK27_9BACL
MKFNSSAQIGEQDFHVMISHFRNPLSVHSKYICHFTIAPEHCQRAMEK